MSRSRSEPFPDMTTCRDCGKRFSIQPLLDLAQPTRCMECLIGLEARFAEEVTKRRSLEGELSRRVGMRRELEELLGVGDTYAPEEFSRGVERLRKLVAVEPEFAALRARLAEVEKTLSDCDDELGNASCPPMTGETIPERIARLAGLVSTTLRDEQAALEGKFAAEARLAEATKVLREIADRPCEMAMPCDEYTEVRALWCSECTARAFLAEVDRG